MDFSNGSLTKHKLTGEKMIVIGSDYGAMERMIINFIVLRRADYSTIKVCDYELELVTGF